MRHRLRTRTTNELIWEGANMGRFLKWANWSVAKMVELLFNTSHLSDIGCTYRLLSQSAARRFASEMKVGGSSAGPEMLMLIIASGIKFVEIPVNYLPRVGTSSVTGSKLTAFWLGLRMIRLILRFHFAESASSDRHQNHRRAGNDPGASDPTWQRHVAAYGLAEPFFGPGRILDLGCGIGHSYHLLSPRRSVPTSMRAP